jgi:hypothetical protein
MLAQVINNCQGPHYIQAQPKPGEKKAGPLLILRPGLNLVDAKDMTERRKANKAIDGLFTTVIKPTRADDADRTKFGKFMLEVRPGELEDKAPLSKVKLSEAIEMVRLTENTDTLKEWGEECSPDKQSDLIKAIKARIRELTGGVPREV